MLPRLLLLSVGAAALLVACNGGDDGLTEDAVRNATYKTEFTLSGEVTLEGGEHREAAAPGSASQIVIAMQQVAIGDLNGDGVDDAAVILASSGGGSGTFFTLEALVSEDGEPVNVASELLGDRIGVESVTIESGEVIVDLLVRPWGAPFAEAPSIAKTVRYALGAGGWHSEARAISICDGAEGLTLPDRPFVVVTSPLSGALVSSGFIVEGCSRTFEATINWVLYDRADTKLADGFATGGGVDGPTPFSFEVTYSIGAADFGRLEVFEPDVSGGEGFRPPRGIVRLGLMP